MPLPEGDVERGGANWNDRSRITRARSGPPALSSDPMTAVAREGGLSARVVRRIVAFAEARGCPAEALCRDAGLRRGALADDEARIPYALVDRLAELVARRVDEPNLGLRLAEDVGDPRHMDPGVLLLMASPTIAEALARMVRVQRYWGDGARSQVLAAPDGVRVRWMSGPLGALTRHTDECAMAEMLLGLRGMTQAQVTPRAVRFRHRAPADLRPHGALFGCPLEFDADHTELELDAPTLAIPMSAANQAFSAIFAAQVDAALARLDAAGAGFVAEARRVMLAASGARCTLEGTAEVLGTTPRTLQRRLADEGTTFARLRDALRRELATGYLEKGMTVADVAWSLGFADVTAFHHAFRRWTGTTPRSVRRPG